MMSEEQILSGRVEKADVFLPFSPSLEQGYDTQPTYRLRINVSESSALGLFEQGYYIKFNESVYYVRKKHISVFTNTQVERLLEYLKRTKREFTVTVSRDKTNSGHQYVQLSDIDDDKGIYTVLDYKVFESLWQEIEYELYENNYSPSIARFTGERLIWYAKLLPQHSLAFTEAGKITLNYVTAQGHLEVYKLQSEGQFTLPNYLYTPRENLIFFNHEIHQKLDVIPLGSERRVIAIGENAEIKSEDHDPITLETGQYLLWHPRPQKNRVD